MITHLVPDILECEVKWDLGSITMNKAGGGDGILVELFQILNEDAVKGLHSICQHIWKTQQWPQDWKGQCSFQSQRKVMPKNAQTTAQLHSSHMLVSEVKLLNHVRLFLTPWTAASQAPPSMGFSRQEYWSGLPFPSPGDLPDSGIEPRSPALQVDALPSKPPGKPQSDA